MLADKLDRAGEETGSGVRGAVQELSKRLSDLRDGAPTTPSARPRVGVGIPGGDATKPEATPAGPGDLALVKAAIEAERQRGLHLRGEVDELIAEVSRLEEESRKVAQLRAEREQWSGRARTLAAAVLGS
jgi:hypothetical protein